MVRQLLCVRYVRRPPEACVRQHHDFRGTVSPHLCYHSGSRNKTRHQGTFLFEGPPTTETTGSSQFQVLKGAIIGRLDTARPFSRFRCRANQISCLPLEQGTADFASDHPLRLTFGSNHPVERSGSHRWPRTKDLRSSLSSRFCALSH